MSCHETRSYRFDKESVRANGTRLTARAASDQGWVRVVIYTNPDLTGPDTFTFHAHKGCRYGALVGAMTPDERADLVLAIALKKPVGLLVQEAVEVDLSLPGHDGEQEPAQPPMHLAEQSEA